jgi:NADPH-dependent 2,4-dienoyl-CoA reductase/sulfur reductase-like enzyme
LRKFPIACVQNPDAGFEARPVSRGARARHVVVVGGGVAGLEAARVAAEVGHRVTLLERAPELGGQVALTARLPRQDAHRHLVEWRRHMLSELGVRVELDFDADADAVLGLAPDVVVVATGSEPDRRYPASIPAIDVLTGIETTGPAVVLDEEGHRKGAAETLAADGLEVTLVGDGIPPLQSLIDTLAAAPTRRRLAAAGVRVVSDVRVASVASTGVVVERTNGERELIAAASVIHAGRHRPVDSLVGILRERGVETISVGDARAPVLVEDAIRSAHDAARAL